MQAWVRGVLVGLIAFVGLAIAASAHGGFWHYAGFFIAVIAAFICFRLIARAYDQPGERTTLIPVPGSAAGRQWIGGFTAVLGLVALFVSSGGHGGAATWIGLLVAVLAFLYVFRLIASSFGKVVHH